MKKLLLASALLIPAMVTAKPSHPAKGNYTFDTVHTQIIFFADHLGFSKSEGEFTDFRGSFNINPANWRESSVKVTINTDSVQMDNDKWDAHMKNADFFDVTKHPSMTFQSVKVNIGPDNKGTIAGNLTMLGVTKPAILQVKFNKSGIHPFSKKYVAGFSATTTVKRSEFGMKYGIPMLGDDIEIRLEVEGIKQL